MGGVHLKRELLTAAAVCIPVSVAGAFLAKRFLKTVRQPVFRLFISVFLILVGFSLIIRYGLPFSKILGTTVTLLKIKDL